MAVTMGTHNVKRIEDIRMLSPDYESGLLFSPQGSVIYAEDGAESFLEPEVIVDVKGLVFSKHNEGGWTYKLTAIVTAHIIWQQVQARQNPLMNPTFS